VETQGRLVRMDMPFVTVTANPELEGKLTEMLGNASVRTASSPRSTGEA